MPKVTMIPPTKQDISGKIRVAAYCRVSTELEEQESSYEAQVSHYTEFINGNAAWTLAGIYADEGISGTGTKKREQFKKMIKDCEADKIDIKAIHNQGYETIKLPFYYFFAFPKGTNPELVQAFTDAVKDIVENDAEYQGKIYGSYYQRPFFKGTEEGLKIYADIDELLGQVNLTGKL